MKNTLKNEASSTDSGVSAGMKIDDRFHVIKSLDRARVFLVSDQKIPEKLFAMKISPRDEIYNTRFNLRREFIIHTFFDHENISSVTEAFETAEYFGFLMEYVGGGDLHSYLVNRTSVNLLESFFILKGVLRGLAIIHERGVIHADIKPENILITSSAMPKITDFGVAREFAALPLMELNIKGTLKYLCPEYARSGMLHTTVDVYAAGLLAYEMLTNQIPLFYEDPVQMFKTRLCKSMPSLGNFINPDTYKELVHAVDTAIDKDPSKRFPDARAFLQALPDSIPSEMPDEPTKKPESISNDLVSKISAGTSRIKTKKIIEFA
jgi:eukaryotic-like serine/threonine-protein kinase